MVNGWVDMDLRGGNGDTITDGGNGDTITDGGNGDTITDGGDKHLEVFHFR
jgi:hypothetical protein